MFLSLSVAASLLALPGLQSGSLEPSFKAGLNEGRDAAIQVRLVISPEGAAIRCTRTFVNGPEANAEAYCSTLRTRKHYVPARDQLGRPAYGVVYLWSHWSKGKWTGSNVPSWNPPDLALTVNRMPRGYAEGSLFRLMLQVAPTGSVEACAVSNPALPNPPTELLCREASADPVSPAVDQQGRAVPSVQEFIVRLTSKGALDKIMKRIRRLEQR